MYLHLGNDVLVPQHNVVAILDLDTTSISKLTRAFLKKAQESGKVINVGKELPKSYVIIDSNGVFNIYVSPLSSQTLCKRALNNDLGLM